MRNNTYRTLAVEGGDQVGKGSAIINFTNRIVDSGQDVVSISLPTYATPLGSLIRKILREGIFDIPELKDIVGTEKELLVRLTTYALNRLEVLDVILSGNYEDKILAFDRSVFSHALTLAYGLARMEGITDKKISELIDFVFMSESEIINTLGLDDCVVQLKKDEEWVNNRSGLSDLFEEGDVQNLANYTYDLFAKRIGDGWKNVYSKKDGKWISHEDIYDEIRDFFLSKYPDIELKNDAGSSELLYIVNIAENMYIGSEIENSLLKKYTESLTGNDKDTMYVTGWEIAKQVIDSTQKIEIHSDTVKSAYRKLVKETPLVKFAIKHYLGERYLNLLMDAIDE
jgi:thymidylate kinase